VAIGVAPQTYWSNYSSKSATVSRTISHTFGEWAVLKLMYAAMQCASQPWQHLAITHFEHRQPITLQEQSNRELWPNITSQPLILLTNLQVRLDLAKFVTRLQSESA
jgi:hypothetical protein